MVNGHGEVNTETCLRQAFSQAKSKMYAYPLSNKYLCLQFQGGVDAEPGVCLFGAAAYAAISNLGRPVEAIPLPTGGSEECLRNYEKTNTLGTSKSAYRPGGFAFKFRYGSTGKIAAVEEKEVLEHDFTDKQIEDFLCKHATV